MTVLIVDLDGTVADCTHRLHHIRSVTPDYGQFYAAENIREDTPIREVIDLVMSADMQKVIITGRPESTRDATEAWLDEHLPVYLPLYMRADGDFRPDSVVKSEIFGRVKALYGDEDYIALEDTPRVVEAYKGLGIKCLQVA